MKLFENDAPIFKGNLHTHTTLSDGRLSPHEAMKLYKTHGYDFLALTDHWRPNAPGEYEGMLVLGGAEMDVSYPDQVVHIVGVGLAGDLLSYVNAEDGPQRMIDGARAAGGRAILCHPAWSLNTPETMLSLRRLTGVEIYNSFSGIPWNAARADSSVQIDMAMTRGFRACLVASDDAHRYEGESCQSYTCVQASDLTREALLKGLDSGACYASQGPAFHQITWEEGVVEVECSPVRHIIFYSNLVWSKDRCRTGENLTHARYQMPEGEEYVRVELIDRYGRRAWSGALWR